MNTFFKLFAVVFTLLFVLGAVVQWNDPDALLWILIYGSAALVSVLFLYNRLPLLAALAVSLLYLGGVLYAWPESFEGFIIGEGEIKNIEEGREAFGLLIMAVVSLVYTFRIRYSHA